MSEQVNFGDQLVSPEEKTERVGAVFSSVARRYDVMNDLMSGGMHRLWKERFVARVKPRTGERILDMAGGTGDSPSACRSGALVTVQRHQCRHVASARTRRRESEKGPLGTGKPPNSSAAPTQFRRLHHSLRIRNVTDIPSALGRARV